ncbi:MAG: hypothetical protein JWL86_5450 [Rhizobium sp.]|nr:hypothetical protein [Rhizobium sp.]
MDRAVLKRAAGWNNALERAEANLQAVKDFKIYGVLVARGTTADRIEMGRGASCGTGSVSSIGWADDLEAELTAAFQSVFKKRVETANAELVALGVTDREMA